MNEKKAENLLTKKIQKQAGSQFGPNRHKFYCIMKGTAGQSAQMSLT